MEPEHGTDERLWITLAATGERGFIVGSCHTYPGRFAAHFPTDGRSRCVSKGEVAECSAEAGYWISGFLNGSVPAPPTDEEDEAAWMERRAVFLATGEWPELREELLGSDPDAAG